MYERDRSRSDEIACLGERLDDDWFTMSAFPLLYFNRRKMPTLTTVWFKETTDVVRARVIRRSDRRVASPARFVTVTIRIGRRYA